MSGSIPIRRIFVEDVIDKEGAIDAEKLLYVSNTIFEAIYGLFDANIEIKEHLNADIVNITFTTAVDYSTAGTFQPVLFPNDLKKPVVGLTVINTVQDGSFGIKQLQAITLSWKPKEDKIEITHVTGLADDTNYTLTLLVL